MARAATLAASVAALLLVPALGLRLGNSSAHDGGAPGHALAFSKDDGASADSAKGSSALAAKVGRLDAMLNASIRRGDAEAGKPVPKVSHSYAASRCQHLFPYAEDRASCRRLQKRICGNNCEMVLPENVTECQQLQATLCYVPQMEPAPAPIFVGEVPHGETPVNVTVCNARRSPNVSALWVAVQGEPARALVEDFKYMDCVQLAGWSHLAIRVYTGPADGMGPSAQAMGAHFCDKKNSIVMVGASGIDDTVNLMFDYVFEDEGYGRPVLCNAVAAEKNENLKVTVESTSWYPFVIRGNATKDRPDGALQYLDCELLALDHADSLEREETLGIWKDKTLSAEVPISPIKTMFLLGSEGPKGKEKIMFRSFNMGVKNKGWMLARHEEMERTEHQ